MDFCKKNEFSLCGRAKHIYLHYFNTGKLDSAFAAIARDLGSTPWFGHNYWQKFNFHNFCCCFII